MKIKLKPPYELSEDEQLAVKMIRLHYRKTYEVISHNALSYKINRKGVELFAKKHLFNIIEENMPTKEQVIEAASTSKEAKDALVKLFPKYFEEEKYIHINDNKKIVHYLWVRGDGEYKYKGFYLKIDYDWKIVEDKNKTLVLVPTKKNV